MEELFGGLEYNKLLHFERKVQKLMKVRRVTSGARDPTMKGRILGCSTIKYLRFVADTGSPVAIIPKSVAIRNKVEIFPTAPDEVSYAGVSGTRLSVVGQCQMYVYFRQMKTTKEVRALVVADEGDDVLIGLETHIDWGIAPECFPLPMLPSDRTGAYRDIAPCFVRSVKETH